MSLHPSDISILDYTYELPPDRIANFPDQKRDGSKLLLYKDSQIIESKFHSIVEHLPNDTVLVFNDTKVITARIKFKNQQGQGIEVFCLGPAQNMKPQQALNSKGKVNWLCMVGHVKKWKEEALSLQKGDLQLKVKLLAKHEGDYEVLFTWSNEQIPFYEILEIFGELPIPPYLKRESTETDALRYQTVYAEHKGSVAAPTAGLHFTAEKLDELKKAGIDCLRLTLHVGAGTFKPVKAAKMEGHSMHAEWMHLKIEAIEAIQKVLMKRIVCVGTTSLRALESLYWMGLKAHYHRGITLESLEISQWDVYDLALSPITPAESLQALLNWMLARGMADLHCKTQIMIAPPYQLKMAKGLFTNFHQPQSTLLLLVAAVIGDDWRKVYAYALAHDFRFLSYGDSSLLLK